MLIDCFSDGAAESGPRMVGSVPKPHASAFNTLSFYLIAYAHSAGPCYRDVVLLWLLLLLVVLLLS